MKNLLASIALILFVAGCTSTSFSRPGRPAGPPTASTAVAPSDAPSRELGRLVEEYFEETLRLNPTFATSIGDTRFNDRYEASFSEEQREASRALDQKYLDSVRGIEVRGLAESERLTRDIFIRSRLASLGSSRFPGHLQPLNQFYSFASSFAQLGSGSGNHPFKTVEDYEDFLGRMAGFERAVDVAIANLRKGVTAGIVQPRVLMEKSIPQLAAHVVDSHESSVFWGPIKSMPSTFSDTDRTRLTAAYRDAITSRVVPAYRRLHDFIRTDYLPHSRASVGLTALPDGEAWYRNLVRNTTTTELTPEEIHEIGLREVARIHGEIEKVKSQVGFKGDLQTFFKYVREDQQFHYTSKEEMLALYRAAKQRIDDSTDRLFDVKPKADYEIRPVEAFRERSAAGGSYSAASADGSRPGVFYLNTFDPQSRSKPGMESLLLHEGSPGHHFQISMQRELESIPRFRRFGGYTAYIEGWGLYAESLGKELGLYTDPYQYYGGLSGELWRAIRLVLDTGIHLKGWSREKAIEYAKANSSTSDTSAVSEVERFIAIPSQALAYKIGELKIRELRTRAEKTLGGKFNIKAFHRVVLEDGALPLDVLETKIDKWIDSSR
ncbi:MAG TPA: DUF885 domain-containing protein [Thermoanaerobaculia bacterium]|nr:DUF885 domain-containing protein [Thermoanaerobaculia bacterium]